MKATFFTVPIVIATLTIIAVWGLGLLAVKASAISTQTSLELLRLHLRVAQLHDQLRLRSEQSLAAEGVTLPVPPGSAPPAAGGPAEPGPQIGLRPWPAPRAAPRSPSALRDGLTQARPVLDRLTGRFARAAGAR